MQYLHSLPDTSPASDFNPFYNHTLKWMHVKATNKPVLLGL